MTVKWCLINWEKKTYKNLVNQITENLQNSKDSKFTFELNGTQYDITVSLPDETKGINIPSMLMMPRNCKQNTNIVLESNNMESSNLHEIFFTLMKPRSVSNFHAVVFLYRNQSERAK